MTMKFFSSVYLKYLLKPLMAFVVFSCLLFVPNFGFSQQLNATASVDTNSIVLGGQFTLNLEVFLPNDSKVLWPAIADTFSNLEVVKQYPVDTLSDKNNGLTLRQKIILTGFDSGYHVLPPFRFALETAKDSNDYSETKPILITVNTIAIDTTRAIRDIKGQVVIPYSWQDFLPYIVGLIILAAVIYLIILYFRNRKRKVVPVEKFIPQRPAHEIALEKLKALEESKLWQQGKYKDYYTQLSDISRTFIENRWMINAMEMTTDEILAINQIKSQQEVAYSSLKQLLVTSDLVKFAKMIPVVTDNEQCMQQAYAFVKANMVNEERKEELPS